MGISTYPIGFSIVDYFLKQWRLIKIGLVNAIKDSVETDEEVGSREKPNMMFDEYGRWVKLVGKRINDGFEDGSRGNKHCIVSIVRLYLDEKRRKKWRHNEVVRLSFK
jgi:hypothetical protein